MRNVKGHLIGAVDDNLLGTANGGTGVRTAAAAATALGLITKDKIDVASGAASLDSDGKLSASAKSGGGGVSVYIFDDYKTTDTEIFFTITDFDSNTTYTLTAGKFPVALGNTISGGTVAMSERIYVDISSYDGTDDIEDTFQINGSSYTYKIKYVPPLISYPKNNATKISVDHLKVLLNQSIYNYKLNIGPYDPANPNYWSSNLSQYSDYGPVGIYSDYGPVSSIVSNFWEVTEAGASVLDTSSSKWYICPEGSKFKIEVSGYSVDGDTYHDEFSIFTVLANNPATYVGKYSPFSNMENLRVQPTSRKYGPVATVIGDTNHDLVKFTKTTYSDTTTGNEYTPIYLPSVDWSYPATMTPNSAFTSSGDLRYLRCYAYPANGELAAVFAPSDDLTTTSITFTVNYKYQPSSTVVAGYDTTVVAVDQITPSTVSFTGTVAQHNVAFSDDGSILAFVIWDGASAYSVQTYYRTGIATWTAGMNYPITDANVTTSSVFASSVRLSGNGKKLFVGCRQYNGSDSSGNQLYGAGAIFTFDVDSTGQLTNPKTITWGSAYGWLGGVVATNFDGSVLASIALVTFPNTGNTNNRPVVYRLASDGTYTLSEQLTLDIPLASTGASAPASAYPEALGAYGLDMNATGDVLLTCDSARCIHFQFKNGAWVFIEQLDPVNGNNYGFSAYGSLTNIISLRRDGSEFFAGCSDPVTTDISAGSLFEGQIITGAKPRLAYFPQMLTGSNDTYTPPVSSYSGVGFDVVYDSDPQLRASYVGIGLPLATTSLGATGEVLISSHDPVSNYTLASLSDTLIPPTAYYHTGYFGAFLKFIDTDTLFVGEPGSDKLGLIHLYRRDATSHSLTYTASIQANDVDSLRFGSVFAMSSTGSCFVSPSTGTINGVTKGYVQFFKQSSTNIWARVGAVYSPFDNATDAIFGSYLAMSSTGAYFAVSTGGTISGAVAAGGVYVYKYDGSAITLAQTILPNDAGGDNTVLFGSGIAMSSDGSRIAIVGNSGTKSAKAICIYDLDSNAVWQLTTTIVPDNFSTSAGCINGITLSPDGNTLYISSYDPYNPNGGSSAIGAGAITTYYCGYDNSWKQFQRFTDANYGVTTSMAFGMRLAVSSNSEVIATYNMFPSGSGATIGFQTFNEISNTEYRVVPVAS